MNAIQISALVLILLGALMPLMCVVKMYMLKKFRKKAVLTSASITAVEKHRGIRNSTYYLLHIRYTTVDNTAAFTAKTISHKKYESGNDIPVMYLTENPAVFKTDFGQRIVWVLAFCLLFFGLIAWFCYWLLHLPYTERT